MARAKATTKKSKPAPITKARQLAAELAASPDDVELQRVFADVLLEQGGEHAIRGEVIQRFLAGKGETVEAFEQAMAKRGLQHVGGFARTWTCSTEDFAASASAQFADEPLLREVVIQLRHEDAVRQLRTLAAVPELARIRRLVIVGHKQRTGRPGVKGLAVLSDRSTGRRSRRSACRTAGSRTRARS